MIKKLLSSIICLFLVAFVAGCSSQWICEDWGTHLHFRDELSTEIIMFGEKMRAERQWVLEDSLVKYNKDVHKIHLLFRGQDIFELCEARHALVEVVDEFLETINSHEGILADHGGEEYTYEDLDVRLKFTSFVEQFVDPMYIAWVHLHHGTTNFYSGTFLAYQVNPYNSWFRRREYFSQSRVIVYAQKAAQALYFKKESPEDKINELVNEDIFQ